MPALKKSSIDTGEIAQFARLAPVWWDPNGPLRSLHKLNPIRMAYIRDRIAEQGLGRPSLRQSLQSLSILDVGCGCGLLTEPLTRLGAKVTGLDASEEAIAEARRHAKLSGLDIEYVVGSAEEFAGRQKFDVVTALEIVEHVADMDSLLASLAKLLKPGGLLILSTVNRTPKSFLLGIVAAEYILRWVPRGTHQWKKFLRPSELAAKLEKEKLTTMNLTGIVYYPLRDEFEFSKTDLGVNYMMTTIK